MLRRVALLVLLLAAALGGRRALAQEEEDPRRNVYGTGAGLEIVLTNSGFGLGGYYKHAVSPNASVFAEVLLAPGKDEREFKFSNYFRSTIPNKANYLLMMPVQVGVLRRLFRNQIEDNFRPYVQAGVGPTFGWEYPYFRDCNADGRFETSTSCGEGENERTYDVITAFPKGSMRFGFNGSVYVGAHFGTSRRTMQGVRVGYGFSYFSRPIQLLEKDVEGHSQRYFGSPSISLLFGRLF